ncbi:MAG: hypothetical protein LBD27_00955 [Tannerella sp.]|jgi:hypothetical protein|nr:hypothetical protein [Tannerella sp.]
MKIAAFYYTQSGQGLEILQSVCTPLAKVGHEIVYAEIVPETAFPYPWTYDSFFQAFPESRLGIGCPVKVDALDRATEAELVIIAYQPWFLSASIPIHGFFQDERVRTYLRNKAVITLCGCRNMWAMAQTRTGAYLAAAGARWVGSIVLQDRYPNLVSVITILRWLIGGRKERSGLWPAAGVSSADIAQAATFGHVINAALTTAGNGYVGLQEQLMQAGAIRYKPSIVFIEKVGSRMFGLWAAWVRRKGAYNSPARAGRLKLFRYYLFTVLFIVSPLGLPLLFYLPWLFRRYAIRKDRERRCYALNPTE